MNKINTDGQFPGFRNPLNSSHDLKWMQIFVDKKVEDIVKRLSLLLKFLETIDWNHVVCHVYANYRNMIKNNDLPVDSIEF